MWAKILLIVFVLYLSFEDEEALEFNAKALERAKKEWKNKVTMEARIEGLPEVARKLEMDEAELENFMKRGYTDEERSQLMKTRIEGLPEVARKLGRNEEEIAILMKKVGQQTVEEWRQSFREAKDDKFENNRLLRHIWHMARRAKMLDEKNLQHVYEELKKLDETNEYLLPNDARIQKLQKYIRVRATVPLTKADSERFMHLANTLTYEDYAEVGRLLDELDKLAIEYDAGTISDADKNKMKELLSKVNRLRQREEADEEDYNVRHQEL